MRRLRSVNVRGVSEVMGKGVAYTTFGAAWIIGFAINKIVDRIKDRDVYENDYNSKRFGYKNVADKVFDVSYAISEFTLRCVLWFLINIVGGIIIGMVFGCISMIALIIGALFLGGNNTVVEEYYYYH